MQAVSSPATFPSRARGDKGALCVAALLLYLLAFLIHSAGAQVFIDSGMNSGEIQSAIGNATSGSLSVWVEGGNYTSEQTSAILTSRILTINIMTDGNDPIPVEFDCNVNGLPPESAIVISNAVDYSLKGNFTLLSCPLVFRNPGGNLDLANLTVSHSKYINGSAVLAAIAVLTTNSPPLTTLTVVGCTFRENHATPLLIQSMDHVCVQIEECMFEANHIAVNDAVLLAFHLNEMSDIPVVVSAGLALGLTSSSLPNTACGTPERARIWANSFVDNRVRVKQMVRGVLNASRAMAILDSINGGLRACGGAMYLHFNGNGTTEFGEQSVVIGGSSNFERNHVNDVTLQIAIGGGLCAHFCKSSSAWRLSIDDVAFDTNIAERTGGLHVLFDQRSTSCRMSGSSVSFSNNSANPNDKHAFHESRGGAMSIEIGRQAVGNLVSFSGGNFMNNEAAEGGALHVYYHSAEERNIVEMSRTAFLANIGVSGAAVYLLSSRQHGTNTLQRNGDTIIDLFQYCTIFRDVLFKDNIAYTSGALSVSFAHVVLNRNVTFVGNQNSAISLVNSFMYINQSASITFTGNIGGLGAGLFSSDSEVILYENTSVVFDGNVAQTTGGAIQANMHTRSVGLVREELTPHCFVRYFVIGLSLEKWDTRFTFVNNKAGQAGAGIFAPDFTPCLFLAVYNDDLNGTAFQPTLFKRRLEEVLFREDPDSNIVNHALIRGSPYAAPRGASNYGIPSIDDPFAQRWLPSIDSAAIERDLDFNQSSVPNTISTDITQIDFIDQAMCSYTGGDGVREDGHEVVCNVAPGEYFQLKAEARDLFLQKRDALLLVTPQVDRETSPYIALDDATSLTSHLSFPGDIGNSTDYQISVVGTARLIVHTLRISFTNCSHGFYKPLAGASKRVCTCGAIHVPQYVQLCDMNRYVYLYQGIWAGDDRPDNCYSLPNDSIASNSGNATDCTPQKLLRKRLHYAICPSGYCKGLKDDNGTETCTTSPDGVGCLYDVWDQNAICKHNRTGRLCGKCPNELANSLTVEDGGCVQCNKSNHLPIILYSTALPIFVIVVLSLNIPLSNDFRGLFFFAACAKTLICPEDALYHKSHHLVDWFNGILNVGTISVPSTTNSCFIPGLRALHAVGLGYVTPAIVLIVMAGLHILSRYNNKVNKWVASRDQNTLSQGTWLLIFFCFQKLLDISIKFFLCLNIFGGDEYYYFYDGTVQCFVEWPHSIYFPVAVVLVVLLIVLMFLSYCLAAEKNIPCMKDHLYVGSILRRGLKNEYRWWAVWDLFRRAIIFCGGLLVIVGCGYRQLYTLCVSVLIFAIHMVTYPYKTPDEDRADQRFRLVTYSTPRFLRSGLACNRLEALVLFNMCILSAVAMDYRHREVVNGEYVIMILATWPVVCFVLLFVYKFVTLVIYRVGIKRCDPYIMPVQDDGTALVNPVNYGSMGVMEDPGQSLLRHDMLTPLLEESSGRTNEESI